MQKKETLAIMILLISDSHQVMTMDQATKTTEELQKENLTLRATLEELQRGTQQILETTRAVQKELSALPRTISLKTDMSKLEGRLEKAEHDILAIPTLQGQQETTKKEIQQLQGATKNVGATEQKVVNLEIQFRDLPQLRDHCTRHQKLEDDILDWQAHQRFLGAINAKNPQNELEIYTLKLGKIYTQLRLQELGDKIAETQGKEKELPQQKSVIGFLKDFMFGTEKKLDEI